MSTLFYFLFACSTKTSQIEAFQGKDQWKLPSAETPNEHIDESCSWVMVSENYKTNLLVLTLNQTSRDFHKSLYYCCPNKNEKDPNPTCYQANWKKR